jgi:hypothetical protein
METHSCGSWGGFYWRFSGLSHSTEGEAHTKRVGRAGTTEEGTDTAKRTMVRALNIYLCLCTYERIRQVQIMSKLPLKALSRLWGRFNELTIPYYLRVPGFKLYAFIFGVK